MKTPSIPPAYWTALATAILAVGAALGLPISHAQSDAIFNLAAIVPTAIIVCSTILHSVRAMNVDKVLHAKTVQAVTDAKVAEAKAATPSRWRAIWALLRAVVKPSTLTTAAAMISKAKALAASEQKPSTSEPPAA